jgi:hypothetical protein
MQQASNPRGAKVETLACPERQGAKYDDATVCPELQIGIKTAMPLLS